MPNANQTLQELLNDRVAAYVAGPRPQELIDAGLDAMFKDVVTDAFRSYGDFTKEFKTAFAQALPANVSDMLHLAKYNTLVAEALKARWAEAAVSETMLAKANAAISEILEEAPLQGEVMLSQLLQAFVDEHKESAAEEHWEAPELRFEDGDSSHCESLHIYFDKEPEQSSSSHSIHSRRQRNNYELGNALHIMIEEKRENPNRHPSTVEIGRLYSAKLDGTPINKELRYHGKWERLVAALYYGQARLVIDCDQHDFTYGIYG